MQVHIISILLASVVAWWVHMDARKRGKSEGVALFWASGTFFLMIVFLPLWLILRPREVVYQQSSTVHNNSLMVCSGCNKEYNEQYRFLYCPYCGSKLNRKGQPIDADYQKSEDKEV